jgi:hypothetical protein
MIDFANELMLESWLHSRGIDMESWGSAGAKTVTDLWREYRHGDVAFEDDPPTRLVTVLQLFIRRGDTLLYELAQEFSDGRTRRRQLPPSEKIVAGESLPTATERCLREELGLEPDQYAIRDVEHKVYERLVDSPSYPGLFTRYTVYTVEVMADNLPESDFWRDNEAAAAGDPVRRHLWGWR